MRVGIIGGGVVGGATARAYLEHAEVMVYDLIKERRTHGMMETISGADLIFLCLPEEDVEPFLRYLSVSNLCRDVMAIKRPNFVIRSTVPVGTTRRLQEERDDLSLAHSPEFLTARCAATDAQMPARNIVGVPNPDGPSPCGKLLADLYERRFPGVPVLTCTSDESELIKLATNGFFSAKIAYFNEINALCERLGLDWDRVLSGVLMDGRIAHSHTKVPGPSGKYGFGGACLVPETPIATPDGWVAVEDIRVGDGVLDGTGTTRVTGIARRNVTQLVSVRARGRSITGSVDHIHMIHEGGELHQRKLGDIRPGDWVAIPRLALPVGPASIVMPPPMRCAKSWPAAVTWTKDLAWAIGLWLADGSRGSYGGSAGRKCHVVSWHLGMAKSEQADKLVKVLDGVGLTVSKQWRVSQGTYGPSRTWCVRVRASWFYAMLDQIGVGRGSHGKRAPLLPAAFAESLIGGWLDGDGSYSSGTISGHSENTDMIRDFDRILLGLGVCGQVSKTGKDLKISSRRDTELVCGWTTRHRFDPSRYVREFAYESPTLRVVNEGRWVVRVQDVTFIDGGEVVAIETESGTYIANGQLTHNCLPKDLAMLIELLGDDAFVAKAARARNEKDRAR